MDVAFAPNRDKFVKALLSGAAGHAFSFPRARSSADDGTARERFHPRPPSLSALAVRGGIENDQRAIHPWQRMALIFSSNMVCVTSSRAKIQPAPLARWRDVARPGGDRFAQRELVCAIARDTSEDSAGTSPTSGRDTEYPADQRYSMGRTEVERHQHSTRFRSW